MAAPSAPFVSWVTPADHAEALSKKPGAPGTLYDTDKSPGYQQGMVEAYRQFLNTGSTEELGYKEYVAMRDAATEHLIPHRREGARKPAEGAFPLSTDPLNPGGWRRPRKPSPKVAADLKEEKLGDQFVIDDSGRNIDAPRGSTNHLTRTQPYTDGPLKYKYIYPAYGSNFDHAEGEEAFIAKNTPEVTKLVDAAMARYEEEAAAAPDDYESVLKAIARAVRVLHVVHPFEDGNGRLNIHLLLPRLLLRHGFPPVVPENMSELFSGTFTADEMVEHLKTALEKGPKRGE